MQACDERSKLIDEKYAIALFTAGRETLILTEDLKQLEFILDKFKGKDIGERRKALAIIERAIDIEIETDYTLSFS